MKCAIVSSVISVQKGVGNWTLRRYASSSFVDKIYQQYFPKGELVENDEEASVISETLERQVGAHAKSTVVTKRKCKHGYLQVHNSIFFIYIRDKLLTCGSQHIRLWLGTLWT